MPTTTQYRTSATLKSAIQEGESAYETGVHTLTILHGQRQQIEAARENVRSLLAFRFYVCLLLNLCGSLAAFVD